MSDAKPEDRGKVEKPGAAGGADDSGSAVDAGNAVDEANRGYAASAVHGTTSTPGALGTPDDLVTPGTDRTGENEPPQNRKRWIVAAMAALALALFAVPFLRGPEDHAQPGSTSAGAGAAGTCAASSGVANLDFTLKDINGADVRLSDYKGKVILLNFWATWCGPCKIEIPDFVKVYDEYRDQGLEILGVLALDDPSGEELRAFADQYKMNYPVFRANDDFEAANGPIYGLPTTFLIDRQGSICSKHMGPVSRDTVEREIQGLL